MASEGLQPPAQLQVSSIVDAVEQSLREQILNQGIASGQPVRETDVARVFNIARPTAKAAIERLVGSGLLRRDAHKSARVPTLSAADVNDLYLTRTMLEAEVCRRLAEQGSAVPPAALASVAAMRALPSDAAPGQVVEPDIAFHCELTNAVGISRLARIHSSLMQEMRLCMAQVQAHHLIDPHVITTEHQLIADAITAGDSHAAAEALRAHLHRARTALVGHLSSDPG